MRRALVLGVATLMLTALVAVGVGLKPADAGKEPG